MHEKKVNRKIILVLLALMLCLLTGCAGKQLRTVTSLDQLSEPGIRIGVPDSVIEFGKPRRSSDMSRCRI